MSRPTVVWSSGSIQAVIEFDPVTHVQRLAAKKSQVLTVTFNGQGHYMCCRRKTLPNTCDTRQACYAKGYDGRQTKEAIYYMLSFCLMSSLDFRSSSMLLAKSRL